MSTVQQCKVCTNRKFNPSIGLICGLTMEKPTFTDRCDEGIYDEKEALRLAKLAEDLEDEEVSEGFFSAEQKGMKKGVLGGVVMMVIAIVWFFGGLSAGYIFYYPPILFVIGVVALVKGLVKGNYFGNK